MYLPDHFREDDPERLHALIERNPLGTLITLDGDEIVANHIPFVLDRRGDGFARLLGHVARANPLWQAHPVDRPILVIFQEVDAYITPAWYATKQETHEVVPTWNYAVAHVSGSLIVRDDVKWLRGQAGMLTRQMERRRDSDWKMADAPQAYLAGQLDHIVGIEIPVARLVGKIKASQNRVSSDRDGAIAGLEATGDAYDEAMAAVMRRAAGEE
ncbi:MAG: FMN-binding negative transcriptional regulator [Thermomicrobiales bacterium]